jgi:hypothetical protein
MRSASIGRRAFVTLLGGGAASPLAVRAQSTLPVVGLLSSLSGAQPMRFEDAFRRGLGEQGYVPPALLAPADEVIK